MGLVCFAAVLLAAGDKKSKANAGAGSAASMESRQPAPPIADDKKIVHALNRFTFGVRPGDVERVRALGLDKWLDQQLHPEKIDDSAVEARVAPFLTLKMSSKEMVENFPPPQVLKAIENGRRSMPHDPGKRAIYESRMAQYQERQQKKQDAVASSTPAPSAASQDSTSMQDMAPGMRPDANDASMTPGQRKQQKQREDAMYADLSSDLLLQQPPEERYKTILKMSPEERLDLARTYKGEKAMQLIDGMRPEQRETIEAIVQPQAVVGGELAQAKLLRAIYSDRQLEEVMTDFWFNHFNVFIGKGPDRYMINSYERDVIRPRALGKFKDILAATAKSPAMLFYLDNWQSVGPASELALYGPQRRPGRNARFPRPRPQQAKNRNGLNENYAREIMELHTLGVDGGYSQKDVTELAKVLTGWSIEQPQLGGSFKFNERAHEPGPKYILGRKIGEHGEKEGLEMLDILAHHPSTAKFISRKLAIRFVSDNPPDSLVARMAETFQKKDGDIREVLRTLFRSPEFWAGDAYRAKMKTPFEFVVSAARRKLDDANKTPNYGAIAGLIMGSPEFQKR